MIFLLPQRLESLKDLPSPGVAVLLQRQSRDVKAGGWEGGKAHQVCAPLGTAEKQDRFRSWLQVAEFKFPEQADPRRQG